MILLALLLGFVLGILFILSVQYFTLSWIFKLSPKAKPPRPPPFTAPSLPPELSQKASGPFREETCQWVNFCGAFLFQELRESNLVKKAIITKLNEEFKEFLLKKTTGQLMHQVTVRDYFLGNSLPQFNSVQVLKVRRDEEELLTEVTVGFDVDYQGGALIAIDITMLLGKTASISVELVRLEGKVRLQFTREPFTHWSIAFMQEPRLEFQVAPEFQGRNVSQITSVIEKLIRRFIKRKHTLPHFKVRRSPLFPKMLPQTANVHLYMHEASLTEGVLELEILGCSRLLDIPEAKKAFCTAALTNKPWNPLNRIVRPSNGPMRNLTVEKTHGNENGLRFQRYQDTEMEFNCIVVNEVVPGSSAFKAGVMKGDIVSQINGVDVKSVSKAKSLIEGTTSSSFIITVQRIFANHIPSTGQLPALMLEQLNNTNPAPTKQLTEHDTEVASLLGAYTQIPEPAGVEEKDTASKHGSIASEKTDPHSDTSSRVFPEEFPNAELFCPEQQQRTGYKFYSRHVSAFPDKFIFNIMPEHKYLSIVLWYESAVLADAALAGHVSIPLSDISVECIATASGKHKQRYVLVPGNPLIPGMSKTHAKHIAASNDQVSKPWLAAGVANKHAQFVGDILLAFSHTPKSMAREDRAEYLPWNRPIEIAKARQRELERRSEQIAEEVQAKHLNVGTHALEDSGSSYDVPYTVNTEEASKEGVHSFITLTAFNQSEHDTCKLCYGELGSELVSKCQHCTLVCHHRCAPNSHQKLACVEKGSPPNQQKAVKTPSLEFHTPLDARLSVNGFETNAERILLNIHPYTADQTDCIADTSRFQDQPLPERLQGYREQIMKMNETMEMHEEVIDSLKQQMEAPCPPESLQPIKSQLSKTEDKQRAIATLLLQYCEGLKILETMGDPIETVADSGSDQDD